MGMGGRIGNAKSQSPSISVEERAGSPVRSEKPGTEGRPRGCKAVQRCQVQTNKRPSRQKQLT